jgi:hypothetical protein
MQIELDKVTPESSHHNSYGTAANMNLLEAPVP